MTLFLSQHRIDRRGVLALLSAIPMLAALRPARRPAGLSAGDETVEVGGWILRRSDLA